MVLDVAGSNPVGHPARVTTKTLLPKRFTLTPKFFGRGFRTMRTVERFHSSRRGTRNVSARRNPTPSYLHHKQSGRARAVWTDQNGTRQQKLLPGPFDSAESRTAFARFQLELEAAPYRPLDATAGVSVNEVLLAVYGY